MLNGFRTLCCFDEDHVELDGVIRSRSIYKPQLTLY